MILLVPSETQSLCHITNLMKQTFSERWIAARLGPQICRISTLEGEMHQNSKPKLIFSILRWRVNCLMGFLLSKKEKIPNLVVIDSKISLIKRQDRKNLLTLIILLMLFLMWENQKETHKKIQIKTKIPFQATYFKDLESFKMMLILWIEGLKQEISER